MTRMPFLELCIAQHTRERRRRLHPATAQKQSGHFGQSSVFFPSPFSMGISSRFLFRRSLLVLPPSIESVTEARATRVPFTLHKSNISNRLRKSKKKEQEDSREKKKLAQTIYRPFSPHFSTQARRLDSQRSATAFNWKRETRNCWQAHRNRHPSDSSYIYKRKR